MKLRKLCSACLAAALLLSLMIVPGAAVTLSDIQGHWAEKAITAGVEAGYISGYSDGTFQPDKAITLGELVKMLNQAIGLSNTASISFSDVSSSDWCYNEVRKAVSAQYINGFTDGTFRAGSTVTRQEAAVMLSRLVTLPQTTKSVDGFADASSIGDWAKDSVTIVYSKGYMQGNQNNQFDPTGALTRAQAAQLVYNLLQGETIISDSNAMISYGGTARNNILYANNVQITSDVADDAVSFNYCRVLGAMTVSGGGAITLRDDVINTLTASRSDGESTISVTGSTAVKRTLVTAGTALTEQSLTGNGFTDLVLSGSTLANGTVKLSGTFDTVEVRNSAVINNSSGRIKALTISGKANVVLQNGSVTDLTIEAAAEGSTVFLANGVTVDTATINGVAGFLGEGTITEAVENTDGVTYETVPGEVTQNAAGSGTLQPTVTPADGATAVSSDTSISLVFGDSFFDPDGSSVTAGYVEDNLVELREGSLTGTEIPFTATVSGKTVTLDPDAALDGGTQYYIVIFGGALQDAEGRENLAYTTSFTTKAASATLTPTVSPSDGTDGVSTDTNVTLTFDESLQTAAGNTLTASYVEESTAQIRESSTTGTLVDFSASVSTDKTTITLTPDQTLAEGTTYYVILTANTLQNTAGTENAKVQFSFTTGSTASLLPTVAPANGKTNVPETTNLKITFDEAVYHPEGATLSTTYLKNTVIGFYSGSVGGTTVGFTATISSDRTTITLTPNSSLKTDTTYYLVINGGTLVSADGAANSQYVSKFSTGTTISEKLTFTPSNLATDVSVAGTVTITFPDEITRPGTTSLSTSYLESTAIQIRKTTSVGTLVPFTAQLSSDGKTVTLQPDDDLDAAATYYVLVLANTLCYSDDTYVTAASAHFATEDAGPLSITVDSGATDTTASFSVTAASAGQLTVTYSGGGNSVTLVSGVSIAAEATRSFDLSGLTASTTYTVTAQLVSSGTTYTETATFQTTTAAGSAALEEITLVAGDDVYPILTSAGTATSFSVTPLAATDATLRLLPAADTVSSVSYRTSSTSSYTTITKSTDDYYRITGLDIVKGDTITLTIRVVATDSTTRTYTVTITCNY